MKRSIIIIGLLLGTYGLFAQYAEDALRYSLQYYQGSARFMAVGGAFGGLGGDFSVLSTNPGGIGVFRNSETILTPSVTNRKVTSIYDFDGTLRDDNSVVFALNNFGYVNAKRLGRGGKGWKYFQYAIGMNRLANYNTSIYMQGENQSSSRIDTYIDDAVDFLNDGGTYDELLYHDPFYVGPAWETYLLDTVSDENFTYLISPVPAGGLMQTQRIETRGSNNEWFGSVGANFNDILYVGATLGFPYIRYYRDSYYAETDVENSETFDNWSVSESLVTKGMGINFKIGAIVRPIDWIRIGAAFHTPSYYWSLTDSWYTYTTSDVYAYSLDEWVVSDYKSVIGEYNYKLTTPMRFIGDLAFIIKKFGFLSAEYEYVNYSNAKFKANDYSFATENENIKSYYTSAHNLRAGAEWRVSSLSLRAGYALYSSPYKNNLNDGARQSYSGGLGYRGKSFAIDFAYVYSKMNEDYYMYIYSDPNTGDDISPKVTNELAESSFILSFKYYFN
ncbi:MAG: hypothetical protein C0591_12330 [Marinilabiliales bacterium]|nr:MAG: hypothetical protein C0591_12330 [Marinilabiliales bacterium]